MSKPITQFSRFSKESVMCMFLGFLFQKHGSEITNLHGNHRASFSSTRLVRTVRFQSPDGACLQCIMVFIRVLPHHGHPCSVATGCVDRLAGHTGMNIIKQHPNLELCNNRKSFAWRLVHCGNCRIELTHTHAFGFDTMRYERCGMSRSDESSQEIKIKIEDSFPQQQVPCTLEVE